MTGDPMREVIEALARAIDPSGFDVGPEFEYWAAPRREIAYAKARKHFAAITAAPAAARLALARAITPDTHAVVEVPRGEA